MNNNYVQYGCGLSAPKEWINYDVSPTLKIQKTPIIGNILKSKLNTIFPDNVLYGNIIAGIPHAENSCDGVYCSHTLEHLSVTDFRVALKNTYKILKHGGIFRCVLPDLENAARSYVANLDNNDAKASYKFLEDVLLGTKERSKGFKAILNSVYGNSNHLWMWDRLSLEQELKDIGFKSVRQCHFNDSQDEMFKHVESEGRFKKAVAFECIK
jgi:predicted SAM-dependent methyltransferase